LQYISVTEENIEVAAFVLSIFSQFTISLTEAMATRIGIVTYSNTVNIVARFSDIPNYGALTDAMFSISSSNSGEIHLRSLVLLYHDYFMFSS
jgi:hypothetical protein